MIGDPVSVHDVNSFKEEVKPGGSTLDTPNIGAMIFDGGTFNKYVRMKIGLFDPPSPLVRKMTSLLLHSLIY